VGTRFISFTVIGTNLSTGASFELKFRGAEPKASRPCRRRGIEATRGCPFPQWELGLERGHSASLEIFLGFYIEMMHFGALHDFRVDIENVNT